MFPEKTLLSILLTSDLHCVTIDLLEESTFLPSAGPKQFLCKSTPGVSNSSDVETQGW